MDVTLVFILLLASIKTTISYRDYPASRMPDYGLDYDMKESRGVHSDDSTRHEHADDEDYKYDYESATSKSPKEFYVEDTTQDNPKRRLPKVMRIDMDKTRNRRRKTFRHETTELESEEDRENKYSLGRDIDHDVDKNDYPLEDDDYKESHEKETSRYNIMRESVNRKARRKPRDRPITVIAPEVEHEGNFEKNVKLNMRKNKLQRNSDKEDIAKKIVIEAFDDMKRVNNFKENHPLIIRQPDDTTKPELIAARELSELLGHRQRKEIAEKYLPRLPSTFSPQAVDPLMENEWSKFIKTNKASQLDLPLHAVLLLNYFICLN